MAIIGDPLFYSMSSLSEMFDRKTSNVSHFVNRIPKSQFETNTDDYLINKVYSDIAIDPIKIDDSKTTKKVDEISIDVADHFGGTATVPGLRAVKILHFSGESTLWETSAGQFSSAMPRGKVSRDTVSVGMEVRMSDADQAKTHIDSTIEAIKNLVLVQGQQIAVFNLSLPSQIQNLITARRSQLDGAKSLLDRL